MSLILPPEISMHYEIHQWRHALSILMQDFPNEWKDLVDTLTTFRLHHEWIATAGGRKSQISEFIDSSLYARGWQEKQFETAYIVDGVRSDAPTHKVDCFKNRVVAEIEWNNKDPFFDRDLNNFRLLFDLRAISVGIIITRCDELQDLFNHLGRGSSYGQSTTHMRKLLPRIEGGGGGGCPILVLGIRKSLYVPDKSGEKL